MKKILVLGGTRFFGKRLVELLIEDGHLVTVMTRGQSGNPFGNKVEHLIVDRLDKEALAKQMEGRFFDIVYDNICYSPKEAYEFCEIFNGKTNKLVFTSTLSTYEVGGAEKVEEDFNPYTYPIKIRSKEEFTYGEGKRQAEAVFYKYAQFPVVAVRFPIVMGEEDYTLRLHYYIERILKEEPIEFVNLDTTMSFIHADEAARFLKWAGIQKVVGPFNACSTGTITLKELIQLIEKVTEKEANVVVTSEAKTPYAIKDNWYMSNAKAKANGFDFTNLSCWLTKLIESIVNDYKKILGD